MSPSKTSNLFKTPCFPRIPPLFPPDSACDPSHKTGLIRDKQRYHETGRPLPSPFQSYSIRTQGKLSPFLIPPSWIFPNCNISFDYLTPFLELFDCCLPTTIAGRCFKWNQSGGPLYRRVASLKCPNVLPIYPDVITTAWTHSRNSSGGPCTRGSLCLCLFLDRRFYPKKCRYVALALVRGTACRD